MDRNVILLGCTKNVSVAFQVRNLRYRPGQSERMPLEVGHLRAREEDILACTCCGLLLLDLKLHHVRRVLDDLRDVRSMTRSYFTKDALRSVDDTSNQPIALKTCQYNISTDQRRTHPEDTDGIS